MTTGTIVEIMESWPIGLRLDVEGEPEHVLVQLADTCDIKSGGARLGPGDLRSGMRVMFIDDSLSAELTYLEVMR